MTPDQKMRTEGNKLLHETMKQLVTISSGSILLMITFWEKVLLTRRWPGLIVVVFVGFLVSIIASIKMMRTISLNVGAGYTRNFQPTERIVYPVAILSFLGAVGALVVFVIKNLF